MIARQVKLPKDVSGSEKRCAFVIGAILRANAERSVDDCLSDKLSKSEHSVLPKLAEADFLILRARRERIQRFIEERDRNGHIQNAGDMELYFSEEVDEIKNYLADINENETVAKINWYLVTREKLEQHLLAATYSSFKPFYDSIERLQDNESLIFVASPHSVSLTKKDNVYYFFDAANNALCESANWEEVADHVARLWWDRDETQVMIAPITVSTELAPDQGVEPEPKVPTVVERVKACRAQQDRFDMIWRLKDEITTAAILFDIVELFGKQDNANRITVMLAFRDKITTQYQLNQAMRLLSDDGYHQNFFVTELLEIIKDVNEWARIKTLFQSSKLVNILGWQEQDLDRNMNFVIVMRQLRDTVRNTNKYLPVLKEAGRQVATAFQQAFNSGQVEPAELENLTKVAGFVNKAIIDSNIQPLIDWLEKNPIHLGEERTRRIVIGAIAAFIFVALAAASIALSLISFGVLAPVTIAAITLSANIVTAAVATAAAPVALGLGVGATFFAVSGRKQGPVLAVDQFVEARKNLKS